MPSKTEVIRTRWVSFTAVNSWTRHECRLVVTYEGTNDKRFHNIRWYINRSYTAMITNCKQICSHSTVYNHKVRNLERLPECFEDAGYQQMSNIFLTLPPPFFSMLPPAQRLQKTRGLKTAVDTLNNLISQFPQQRSNWHTFHTIVAEQSTKDIQEI